MNTRSLLPTLALCSLVALPFAHAQQPMEGEGAGDAGSGQSIASDTGAAGENWAPELRSAFFTDETLATIRPGDEIEANWAGLDAEQQGRVREDCDAAGVSAASTGEPEGTAPSSATDPDSQASGGAATEESNPTTPAPSTLGSVGESAQSTGSIGSATTPADPAESETGQNAQSEGQGEAQMTRASLIQICQLLPAE